MITFISPAKTLDFETEWHDKNCTEAPLLNHSKELVSILKKSKPEDLQKLMGISEKLATLNAERFGTWTIPMPKNKTKPALRAFKGDVYVGIDIDTLKQKEINYLQKNLKILSGLYGVLKPMDLILPYRLEMGTDLKNKKGKNLYAFWKNILTEHIVKDAGLSEKNTVINLASNEYFKAIDTKILAAEIITPIFKDWSSGKYKVISFHAKKARGLMCRYMAQNNIKKAEDLRDFNLENYRYDSSESTENEFVFLRKSA